MTKIIRSEKFEEDVKKVEDKYDTLELEIGAAKSDLVRAEKTISDFKSILLGAFLVLAVAFIGFIFDRISFNASIYETFSDKNQEILELKMQQGLTALETRVVNQCIKVE